MKSGKWCSINLEGASGVNSPNFLVWTIIIHQWQGFILEEWNWPMSCLNDSETQEREL